MYVFAYTCNCSCLQMSIVLNALMRPLILYSLKALEQEIKFANCAHISRIIPSDSRPLQVNANEMDCDRNRLTEIVISLLFTAVTMSKLYEMSLSTGLFYFHCCAEIAYQWRPQATSSAISFLLEHWEIEILNANSPLRCFRQFGSCCTWIVPLPSQ